MIVAAGMIVAGLGSASRWIKGGRHLWLVAASALYSAGLVLMLKIGYSA